LYLHIFLYWVSLTIRNVFTNLKEKKHAWVDFERKNAWNLDRLERKNAWMIPQGCPAAASFP
jgi:hypothetical protein